MPAAAGEKEPILLYGIGAQKAGTTWLFKQLERHPKVFLAQPKELHYWDCIRAPFNHAFPHFGPLAALMYMPAKFRIRFLDPIDIPSMPADTIDDAAAVQTIAEEIRARIQISLDEMLAERRSVWLG